MRLASLLVLVLSALLSNLPARADTYPSRFIRMVVPYPAGGTSDVLARVLAKKMGDSMGQRTSAAPPGRSALAAWPVPSRTAIR